MQQTEKKNVELRVASTIKSQVATEKHRLATEGATTCATNDLKSLAERVLARNCWGNYRTTRDYSGRNSGTLKEAHKLRPVDSYNPPYDEIEKSVENLSDIGRFSDSEVSKKVIRVYRYMLSDQPGRWLTLISVEGDIENIWECLTHRFGEGRVLDLKINK